MTTTRNSDMMMPTRERPYFVEYKPVWSLEGERIGYEWFVRNINDNTECLQVLTNEDAFTLASHLNEA